MILLVESATVPANYALSTNVDARPWQLKG